jgi:hypothetical protein
LIWLDLPSRLSLTAQSEFVRVVHRGQVGRQPLSELVRGAPPHLDSEFDEWRDLALGDIPAARVPVRKPCLNDWRVEEFPMDPHALALLRTPQYNV